MIVFLTVAAVMSVIAAVWLFYPSNRHQASPKTESTEKSNLAILRDQIEELEADFARGVIGEKERDEARAELNRRAIEEADPSRPSSQKAHVPPASKTPPTPPARQILWAVTFFLGIVLVGGSLYAIVGTPAAFNAAGFADNAAHGNTHADQDDFDATLASFAHRMAAEPENLSGWMLLARSYAQTGRLQDAANAYEHILSRNANDADVLADYADLLGAMQEGNLGGKAMEMIRRALKVDPDHWKALALAGTEAFDRNDFATAEKYWVRAQKSAPDNAEIARMLETGIKEARANAKK
ncbi:MAG: c-type cytochrome biogenesis protein CcmI [Burkholderiales bacterium]|nr:c-type cytochrome biogenesis protein CcmI [Burkholderiales bacterium]